MAELYNKIIYGGKTLIDLTGDTVTADRVLTGSTFHDKSGATKVGTCPFDSDTSSATATEAEILATRTAFGRGSRLTGKMPNNGAVKLELQSKSKPVTIPLGYHDGSGTVSMNASDAAKLIPANIRQGVEILDVVGEMTGTEDIKLQSKDATPKTTAQTILPDDGFNGLSQVKVAAIPYVESANSAGGTTVTIG